MKNLAIFNLKLIFFILASLEKLWQSIYNCIYFVLAIVDLEMVLTELLGPGDLFGIQTFYIYEPTKIVVIYEDKHFMLATF